EGGDGLGEGGRLGMLALEAVGQILAGAEALARAGEQHGTHAVIGGAGQGSAQCTVHLLVEGVELVRAIERDRAHAAAVLDKDARARHGDPPDRVGPWWPSDSLFRARICCDWQPGNFYIDRPAGQYINWHQR